MRSRLTSLDPAIPAASRAFHPPAEPGDRTRRSQTPSLESMRCQHPVRTGFTLIELLVVVAIILLVIAILIPSLTNARVSAKTAVCGSNLRQLAMANHGYAAENRDYFVPAASDEFTGFGGRHRWHGVRKSQSVSPNPLENHFDPQLGPLVRYIRDGKAKECPAFRDYTQDGSLNAFEAGAGGYGYNNTYVGGRYDLYGGGPRAVALGAQTAEVQQPSVTVMFTDAAYAQRVSPTTILLIESSFSYPPYQILVAGEVSSFMSSPSIHFRHARRCQVAWVDGHIDAHRMSFSGPYLVTGIPASRVRALDLGWFGPHGNDWFDLK